MLDLGTSELSRGGLGGLAPGGESPTLIAAGLFLLNRLLAAPAAPALPRRIDRGLLLGLLGRGLIIRVAPKVRQRQPAPPGAQRQLAPRAQLRLEPRASLDHQLELRRVHLGLRRHGRRACPRAR